MGHSVPLRGDHLTLGESPIDLLAARGEMGGRGPLGAYFHPWFKEYYVKRKPTPVSPTADRGLALSQLNRKLNSP
jgi:hypothetical protein